MSKITERGQITLPKRVRTKGIFRNARVVEFVELPDAIVVRPVQRRANVDEHQALLNHTMKDWLGAEHDNLFSFPRK